MSDGIGIDLSVFAKIGTSLDEMNARGRRQEAAWIQRATDSERDYFTRGQGICPSGGTFSFALGRPQQGRVHQLRALRVAAPLATTAVTWQGLYLIQSPSDPVNVTAIDTTSLIDYTAAAPPRVAFYSARQVILRSSDQLWVVIVGGTSAQQYVANAQWEDYADGAYRAVQEF